MTPQKNGEGQDLVCVQHQTKRRNCKRVRPAIYSSMTLRNGEREREEKEKEREEDKDKAQKLDDKKEEEGIKECDGEYRNNGSLLSYFFQPFTPSLPGDSAHVCSRNRRLTTPSLPGDSAHVCSRNRRLTTPSLPGDSAHVSAQEIAV